MRDFTSVPNMRVIRLWTEEKNRDPKTIIGIATGGVIYFLNEDADWMAENLGHLDKLVNTYVQTNPISFICVLDVVSNIFPIKMAVEGKYRIVNLPT